MNEKQGRCEAPECKEAATHEYMWLGRTFKVCVLHMEQAVEFDKSIGRTEVEESVKPIKPVGLMSMGEIERIAEDIWGE
jgi:hypothetical protein